MRLYHLTTTAPCGGTVLASGSFSASRKQEIVVGSGTHLHLYRRLKSGVLHPAITTPVFGLIRALGVFRLPGTARDFLAVTSDSGCVTVLRADPLRSTFVPVANEAFGRTGARRTVPGEYLAVDPQGRALMVAAVERQKFVYVLGRDGESELALSSPLEAHKSSSATHALAALDVGFDNPVFAALERSYEAGGSKCLVYYELDLGLNHVVRKLASPVADDAFVLIAVPGDTDGPGGVLVCSGGTVSYRHLEEEDADGNLLPRNDDGDVVMTEVSIVRPKRIEARLPYRASDGDAGQGMVVCGTLFKHKDKGRNVFFFMLCNEHGDLLRVELLWTPDVGAMELRMAYFDSLPAPAIEVRILKSGYLFALMEGGDSLFLKFKRSEVPADDPAGGFSSSRDEADANGSTTKSPRQSFRPRKVLTHLSLAESTPSLAPALGMLAGDFTGEGASQLVLAGGRGGGGGSVRVLRPGLAVSETLELKMGSNGVFGLLARAGESSHKYLAISFPGKTSVLRMEDEQLREVSATFGFRPDAATLVAGQMGADSFAQIHAKGVRFVPGGDADKAMDWRAPSGSRVVAGAVNNAQVLAALSTGVVVYFELSQATGALVEASKIAGALVVAGDDEDATLGAADADARPSLALPDVPAGRTRAQFFAVADGASQKVRIYKLDADGSPQRASLHLAPAPVDGVALVDFGDVDAAVRAAPAATKGAPPPRAPRLVLFVGTKHGALVRLDVDAATGGLSQQRSLFLGPVPVGVQGIRLGGVPACVVMAKRPWIFFPQGARVAAAPLCTEAFRYAAAFNAPDAPGFVTAGREAVRMLSLPALDAVAASAALPTALPPAAVPAATAMEAGVFRSKFRTHATPRRLVPLFSLPKGAGGVGEAARPGAVGVDTDALVAQRGGAKVDRTGHELFVVVETDHRAALEDVPSEDESGGEQPVKPLKNASPEQNGAPGRTKNVMKRMRAAGAGSWVSQLRLVSVRSVDEISKETDMGDVGRSSPPFLAPDIEQEPESVAALDLAQLKENECILCAAASRTLVDGEDAGSVSHVVVSICRNLRVNATGRTWQSKDAVKPPVGNELRVFRVDARRQKLEFVHRTPLDDGEENSVTAIVAFRDLVLVGAGRTLRAYKLGKKQLLRRGELRHAAQNKIAALCVSGGDRVFVGDVQDSVTVIRFTPDPPNGGGRFALLARDSVPRWTTAMCVVDYSTVALGDKFGNVALLRMPDDAGALSESGARDVDGRLSVEACVHVGAAVTQVALSGSTVRYATAGGAIGVLVAMPSEADAALAKGIERAFWQESSIVGRDHASFRSAFYPVKNVFDGDLCEMFLAKDAEAKGVVAKEVGREPADMVRALLELRWFAESQ